MSRVPAIRIRQINDAGVRPDGEFVLYWMIANRRARWNFSLDRAVEYAAALDKPLVVLEALRCGYQWASDRIHRFVLQGMSDNRAAFRKTPARYYAYVEPELGQGSGLLEELGKRASVVVTDEFPCFFLPRMVAAAGERLGVTLEAVDSNGLVPLRATDRVFARAYDFRRWLQRNLPPFLSDSPLRDPFAQADLRPQPSIPQSVLDRWPEATDRELQASPESLNRLPIDHSVAPAVVDGGMTNGHAVLDRFVSSRLARYADERNDPVDEAASGLSPFLHFGHVSGHEVFSRVTDHENWTTSRVSEGGNGSREGWWGMSRAAESFLDELITWRELGYNMCAQREDYASYESLPDWSRKTLAEHAGDPREFVYSIEEFESADTHDEIWNAAQTQLVRDGRIHNYMRMLWGKKILEWSPCPQDALATMIHLNNKFAVDGRNPNSYSGIFWVLGRYDRAWGPERAVFGKIRYMSSASTARKLNIKPYLRKYSPAETHA